MLSVQKSFSFAQNHSQLVTQAGHPFDHHTDKITESFLHLDINQAFLHVPPLLHVFMIFELRFVVCRFEEVLDFFTSFGVRVGPGSRREWFRV